MEEAVSWFLGFWRLVSSSVVLSLYNQKVLGGRSMSKTIRTVCCPEDVGGNYNQMFRHIKTGKSLLLARAPPFGGPKVVPTIPGYMVVATTNRSLCGSLDTLVA